MNIEQRITKLEDASGMNDIEGIVSICSNVKDGNYPSPNEQIERQRVAGNAKIIVRKFCGRCNESCNRRENVNESHKQN